MTIKITLWTGAAGGVAWGNYKDGFMMTPIFTSQDSFEIVDKKIKEMDRSKLIVTIVEHHDNYTVIFYEDPSDDLIPNNGFLLTEMNLEGYYAKFKRQFKMDSKLYFTYGKQLQEPMPMQSSVIGIQPLIEPFLVKAFRIISESDLELSEFKKRITKEGYSPKEFKYHNEALAIITTQIKK